MRLDKTAAMLIMVTLVSLTDASDKLTLKLLVSRDLNVGRNARSQRRQR